MDIRDALNHHPEIQTTNENCGGQSSSRQFSKNGLQSMYIMKNFTKIIIFQNGQISYSVFGRPLQVTVRRMLGDRCPACPVCL